MIMDLAEFSNDPLVEVNLDLSMPVPTLLDLCDDATVDRIPPVRLSCGETTSTIAVGDAPTNAEIEAVPDARGTGAAPGHKVSSGPRFNGSFKGHKPQNEEQALAEKLKVLD